MPVGTWNSLINKPVQAQRLEGFVDEIKGSIMATGYVSKMGKSGNFNHSFNHSEIPLTMLGWILYRFGLVIFGLLWVFLSSTLCGCGTINGYAMNRSGKRYFDKGNYEYARYEFERALMDDPHNANYAFNVARAMEREGEYENAEMMYQHALTLNPNHLPSYHSLASILREQGRVDESRELLVAWAETQPYSFDAQRSAANLYQQEGNYVAAQRHYEQAMRDLPQGRPSGRQFQPAFGPIPQQQMVMQNGPQVNHSPRYPHSTAPSLQMATTMPQTDFTMMGGPVVAPRTVASMPVYQQSFPTRPAEPTWSPSPGMPTPQPYLQPGASGGEPQLLPELPAPNSQYSPQTSAPQEFVSGYSPDGMRSAPQFGDSPQRPSSQQMIPNQWVHETFGQFEHAGQSQNVSQYQSEMSAPSYPQGSPVQNISTQQQANVVPAIQAF